MPLRSYNILFAIRDAESFHYKHILTELAFRGHRVRVVYDTRWTNESELEKLKQCTAEYSHVEYRPAPHRKGLGRIALFYVREILSYRRYLLIPQQSSFFRERWKGYLPALVRRIVSYQLAEYLLKSGITGELGWMIERMIPSSRHVRRDITLFAPDVIFASPLTLRFSSTEVEYVKAGMALGIPCVSSVLTWDNLSSKGLIHVWPTRLLVWNKDQVREANECLFFPRERMRIVGATMFDDWFEKSRIATDRIVFCRQHGLDPEHPIVLYLGSSQRTGDETWIVERLYRALRSANDPRLQRTQLMVRPHPANSSHYKKLNLSGVHVIPQEGMLPIGASAFQLFFDSIHHAVCSVMGVGTSRILDTMIAGKPALAIISDEYKEYQVQAYNFQHLLRADALETVGTPEECMPIIQAIYNGKDSKQAKRETFIRDFMRPRGIEKNVGALIADEIESLVR